MATHREDLQHPGPDGETIRGEVVQPDGAPGVVYGMVGTSQDVPVIFNRQQGTEDWAPGYWEVGLVAHAMEPHGWDVAADNKQAPKVLRVTIPETAEPGYYDIRYWDLYGAKWTGFLKVIDEVPVRVGQGAHGPN